MAGSPLLLVFSDLDGTLLDHDTYGWDAARPALQALAEMGAGVVLASSKTAPELVALRAAMGLADWPAIVENGAGLLAPRATVVQGAQPYADLRLALDGLPQDLRKAFVGFGDLDAKGIADITGLPRADAALAGQRAFSEPGLWHGDPALKQDFLSALRDQGITAREGGRFLTLSFGQTKADQMANIIASLRPRHTVALGDAPNDVEMLEAADHGVIIANPHRAPLPALKGEAQGRITRSTLPGPDGWNRALLDLIAQLELA